MNRKLLWGILITLVILALLAVAATMARNYAFSKVSKIASQKLKAFDFSFDATPTPFTQFSKWFCFESITVSDNQASKLTLHDVCITNGLNTITSDKIDAEIEIQSAQGALSWDSIKTILNRHAQSQNNDDSEKISLKEKLAKLINNNIKINCNQFDLKLGAPGSLFKFSSPDASFDLRDGAITASATLSWSIDLAQAPLAIQSSPEFKVRFDAPIAELIQTNPPQNKYLKFELKAEPTLDIATTIKDELIVAQIAAISTELNRYEMIASLDDLNIVAPNADSLGNAHFQSITAAFSGRPSQSTLKTITLVNPDIRIKIDEIIRSEKVLQHAVFGNLLKFWQQDAGSILGDAPKLSVRREDVKKTKPKVRSNPLSKEFLLSVKAAFQKFQKSIMALPAIDIQNGSLQISLNDNQFAFESISFNTAELFQDDQKFKLQFNVRQATAAFEVSYDDDSPFPQLSLSVLNLAARDFLSIINMPVPENSDGSISAQLSISMDDKAFSLSGNMTLDDFAFFHAKVSPNLIHDMNAAAQLDLVYSFNDDKLSVNPIALTSGPITTTGFINITNVRSNPVIEFELGAKDIKCSDIPKAIPPGFLPTITDLQIAGDTFSPKLYGKIPWKDPLISSLKESGFEDKCYPTAVEPHKPSVINDPKYTFTTDYTYFTDAITVGPGTKSFTPIDKIPPYVKAAMFLTEDKRFFDHGPLRISFIERALRLNLNSRKYVYGGSTISQQLTKNLFLDRRKNLARKLEEAFIAWRMENVVSKMRIFELYINMIEFGPDVYGITQAAKFYFDKSVEKLTPLEGAYLASLKVMPSKGGRFYKSGFPTSGWWPKRMKYILKVLAENGYISASEVIAAYPWIPKFVYPNADQYSDFRNVWLRNYSNYLIEQSKQKKIDEKNKNDAPDLPPEI